MIIYTDWACVPNPWKWWWWFVLVSEDKSKYEEWWWEKETTNNRMELTAIIKALLYCDKQLNSKYKRKKSDIVIISDSQYCVNACNKRMFDWEKNWKLEDRANPDLFQTLLYLTKKLNPQFLWVRWHNWNKWNEYADKLSNNFIKIKEK